MGIVKGGGPWLFIHLKITELMKKKRLIMMLAAVAAASAAMAQGNGRPRHLENGKLVVRSLHLPDSRGYHPEVVLPLKTPATYG